MNNKQEIYLKIQQWPPDHASEAYGQGFYLEAIQTLHGWLECKLRELFLLQRINGVANDDSWGKAWDVSNEFSLNNAAKGLFLIGALSADELEKISKFNRVRNNLIHKLFYDPYDEKWQGVKKDELDQLFNIGLDLCTEIENKSGEIVMENNPSNVQMKRTNYTSLLPK